MGGAAFVEYPHLVGPDCAEAGISPALLLVEQQAVLALPAQAAVQTGFDAYMVASLLARSRGRVGEQEYVPAVDVFGSRDIEKSCHTYGLLQAAGRRMRGPGSAQVFGDAYHPALAAVVAAVEHKHARSYLCHLGLGSARAGPFVAVPGLPSVLAVHYQRTRHTVRVKALQRKDQSAVLHCDASSGALKCHSPFRPFDLAGDVARFAPGLAVVSAFHHQDLSCRNRVVAVSHSVEGVPVAEAVGP